MTRKTTTVIKKEVAMDDHDSPAVLAYRVGQLEKNQIERFDKLETKLDDMTKGFVTIDKLADAQKAADEKHREQDSAIKKLEDWNVWAQRLVIGAVIASVIALVLKGNHVF